jgi:hypothetical protein
MQKENVDKQHTRNRHGSMNLDNFSATSPSIMTTKHSEKVTSSDKNRKSSFDQG